MLQLIDIFKQSQGIFLAVVFIFSLLIGSFLNVMIFRLPVVLQRIWRKQCHEFLETNEPVTESMSTNSLQELLVQNSHCIHCKKQIHFYDNIPLLSYLLLSGKCRHCKQRISLQYPIIEGLSATLATIVAVRFGVSWQTIAGCMLTYVLIIQATIDIRHTLIPDELTLPMLWIGLLVSIPALFVNSSSAILGAACGYLCLWLLFWAFYFITKKEGMGYGDFKLLAMLGAWIGWQMLPFTVLCSSVLGSVIGLVIIFTKRSKKVLRIPFGPFLAVAGWIALLYGQQINDWYIRFAGIF